VGKFYEKLLQMEKNAQKSGTPLLKSLADAMSTHPPSEERVSQMRELAQNSPAARSSIVTSPEFNRARLVAGQMQKK